MNAKPGTMRGPLSLAGDYEWALAEFQRQLEDENVSPRTMEIYMSGASRFLAYVQHELGAVLPLSSITKEHSREWLRSLRAVGLKPASIRARYAGGRRLFEVLIDRGEAKENPFHGLTLPQVPMKEVRIVDEDEMRSLLSVCERDRSVWGDRDGAILMLLYDAGVRADELLRLTWDDVDWKEGALYIMGKGARPRRVGLGMRALRSLRRYLNAFREYERKRVAWARLDAGKPVWLSMKGGGEKTLTHAGLKTMIERRSAEAGVRRHLTPHLFRHTSATRRAADVNESELRAHYGWSPNSVQVHRYTRSNLEERAVNSARRTSPGDRL